MGRRSILRALAAASVVSAIASVGVAGAAAAASQEIAPVRVVGGLRQAVAFTFDAEGRIWFVEKGEGNVRIFDPADGGAALFFHVPDVFAEAEQGLVGIELDPGFPERPYVYLYATRLLSGELLDQLLRVEAVGGSGADLEVLWSSPASSFHQHSGGRLLFGPDGYLYMTVGDALQAELAQDPLSDRGKVLRLRVPEGDAVPAELETEVVASGIRNAYGLAFDPISGRLWETENGPICNDEVNRIDPGANYGWGPNGDCGEGVDPASTNVDGPDVVMPELSFTPTIAPTGIAFCDGCGLGPRSEGAIFFADYNRGEIHRATLDASRSHIVAEQVVTSGPDLALSVEVAPDGSLYFSSYITIFRLELRGTRGSPSPSPSPEPSPSEQSPTGESVAPDGPGAPDQGAPSGEGGTSGAAPWLIAAGVVLVVASGGFLLDRGTASGSGIHRGR